MDDTQHSELIRIRHAVIAMRDWNTSNYNAILATIDQLLPKEQPQQPAQPYTAKSLRALCRNNNTTHNRTRRQRKHG